MERRKRLAATLGLVALVLLDVVLVFAALRLFGRGQSATPSPRQRRSPPRAPTSLRPPERRRLAGPTGTATASGLHVDELGGRLGARQPR